ncbi:MAG: M20/M25/M40 family metallo-hydrolase [bacterium]|nr:M20/M25/M40 family metallo-hydrolase [bacterium]
MREILQKLISYRTTRDNPEEINKAFQYIASLFDKSVFDVQDFEHNGTYSQLVSFKGKDALHPRILLNGHLDVVPADNEEQYEMRTEGTKAFGRGTSDMKGMCTVLIEAMRELGKGTNPPDVALLLTGDEEVGGEDGVGYVIRETSMRPQFVACADTSDEDGHVMVTKEKGSVWVEMKAEGRTAHGAYPWRGENALEKLVAAIEKIKQWVGPMEPDAWKTTVNVAVLETSNKTPNKVPADARGILDIRFTEATAKTPQELIEKIRALVPEVSVHGETNGSLLVVDENNPFLQTFKRTTESIIEKKVIMRIEHGATDARYFAEIGVPTVIFGAIGGGWHAPGEWIDLESLEQSKNILTRFLASV